MPLPTAERPIDRMAPEWEPLLCSVGRLHGLDADAAAMFAKDGVLGFDDILVALVDRRRLPAPPDDDADRAEVAIVCPLARLATQTAAGLLRVLRANFLLTSTTGFSIGSSADDTLHLILTTRLAGLGAERLAASIGRCATLADALQHDFAVAVAADRGGVTRALVHASRRGSSLPVDPEDDPSAAGGFPRLHDLVHGPRRSEPPTGRLPRDSDGPMLVRVRALRDLLKG